MDGLDDDLRQQRPPAAPPNHERPQATRPTRADRRPDDHRYALSRYAVRRGCYEASHHGSAASEDGSGESVLKRDKNSVWTPDAVRRRIRTGVLITKLKNHALGKCEMTQTQVAAAKILLAKIVPDLRAIEHSGEINHRHANELSDATLGDIATRSSAGTVAKAGGSKEPGAVH